MENIFILLTVAAIIGIASSYLGSFMVVRRMSLVGDALSHVALPGIAIALVYGINPMIGALIALAISTVGIWYLSEHSSVYPEAIVGVFFTASLSLGLLLTPEPELLESLFGDIDKVTMADSVYILVMAAIVIVVTYYISKKLILLTVSEDLAKSQKVNVSTLNLVYMMLVGLVVALGIKFLGTLLTGAMVIIPAVSAKTIATSIKNFQIASVIFGAISAVAGVVFAKISGYPSGPIIILTSVIIFLLCLGIKRLVK